MFCFRMNKEVQKSKTQRENLYASSNSSSEQMMELMQEHAKEVLEQPPQIEGVIKS